MMSVYAIVKKGVVTNVAVWDGKSDWVPESGKAVLAEGTVDIGWLYDGKEFTPPDNNDDSLQVE